MHDGTDLKLDFLRDVEQRPDLALKLLHALWPWLDLDPMNFVAECDDHDGIRGPQVTRR